MTAFRILLIALSWFVIVLAGCAEKYRYIPPESQAGLQCVTQCMSMKNTCRDREVENARIAQEACEKNATEEYIECKIISEEEFVQCQEEAKEEYYACLKYASDRSSCEEKQCEKKHCYERTCYESANFRSCDSDYRECYQQCGGIVEVIK